MNALTKNTLTKSLLALGALLPFALCRPVQAQTPCTTGPCTVDVTQAPYNADKTGATDASAAIDRAVIDTVAYGNANNVAVTVSLPAGTYFLQNDVIRIHSVQNTFTLTGHSASDTFLTYTNYQNNGVFDLAYNNNAAKTATVTIQNFTEDVNSAAEFGFTQGTIIGIDKAAKPNPTITVRAEAGYPLLNRPDVVAVTNPSTYYNGSLDSNIDTFYTFSDPKTSLFDGDLANMARITPSADGTTAVIAVDHIPSHSYIGEPWMILSNSEVTHNNNTGNNYNRIRGGTAIYSGDNVTLQNINYYGGNVAVNDGGAGLDGNMTFINYYQGAPPAVSQPGRPARPGIPSDRRQACYEGFQMGVFGTTTCINCDFSGDWDDPLDIGNRSARILAQNDPTHIRINRQGSYQPGDSIEFSTPDYGTVYAPAAGAAPITMTGIAPQPDGSFLVTLSQAVTIQTFGTGDDKTGDNFTDLTSAGPIVLQNSSFSAMRGHLFLKSGSSILVDHCLIHDIPYSGIEVSGSAGYSQGPFTAHNVTIQNSTFKNCQQGCIHSVSGTGPYGQNVKILNNTFQDTTNWPFGDPHNDSGIGTAVEVDGVNGLTISGNTFERNWGANIGARYNANLVISSNTFNHPNFIRPTSAAPYSGNYADPSSVVWLSDDAGVTLSGNIVSGAGPYTKSLVEVKTNVTNATGLTNGVLQIDNPLAFYLAYDAKVMEAPSSGSILDQNAWKGGAAQKWLVNPAPSAPGFVTLTNFAKGRFAGNANSLNAGDKVFVEAQAWMAGVPSVEQLWNLDAYDAGGSAAVNILNENTINPNDPYSGFVINVYGNSNAAGAQLCQWYKGNAQNQNFQPLAPPAPLAQINYENVTLNWSPASSATNYTVSRATSAGGTYGTLGTTAGTTYTDGSGTPGTTYYYKVAANGTPLTLQTSPAVPAKPLTTQTNVPVNLSQVFNVTGIEPNTWVYQGGGFDGVGYSYSSVPTSLTWSGAQFSLGSPAKLDAVADAGQRIVLPMGSFNNLLFLGAYLGQSPTDTGVLGLTVTYTDGSSTALTQGMTNWCGVASQPGEADAATYSSRSYASGISQSFQNYIHGYSLAIDPTKTVQWLDIASVDPNQTGQFRLMAATLTAQASVLPSGGVLQQGEYITSPGKKCYLTQQSDGNLVLYAGSGPSVKGALLWNAGNTGSGGVFYTVMQGDGNLVTYAGTPGNVTSHIWASGTYTGTNYYLQVTDAGQVQIMCGNAPVWVNGLNQQSSVLAQGGFLTQGESLTSPSGNCYLIQQNDGNLVLYNGTPANPTGVIWASSNETGKYYPQGNYYLAMQTDGNLVTYAGVPPAQGAIIWPSGTYNHPNSYLRVTDTKQVQVVNGTTVLWQRP